ncbi:glycosyl transferase [Persicitalea jodogahamensis]|uniref:Glycosyl transferase n=2 Tax=Persicitalea jodogahamensis TaxID=402147 RepID=A0A8J3D5Q1_9BACT|nr:glycosyl transferase [Persicitalea jodogahamensis]
MPSARLAPIIVFCYNRPQHLRQTLDALRRNPLAAKSDLIVFSDGSKGASDADLVREVRELLAETMGFRSLTTVASPQNKGLAKSVIEGVSQILDTHETVIVLEDDMICTPDFLDYMNAALEVYRNRPDIFSVTGYTPPIALPPDYTGDAYLAPRASSWGWGTWRDRWQKADWQVGVFAKIKNDPDWKEKLNVGGDDLWPMLIKQQRGVIDSWAIRWTLAQMQHSAYGLYPVKSKIMNIGTDGSGTNFTFKANTYGQELAIGKVDFDFNLQSDPAVQKTFRTYYNLPWRVKLKNRMKYGV